MATSTTLTIQGHQGEAVPNTFLHPDDASNQLAILLPGFGYTLDMPLFYYAENMLLERGWDVLRVEYAYNQLPDFLSLPDSEWAQWLFADATAAWHAALAQRTYERVVLIGKSLGTLAMGHLLTLPGRPSAAAAVWLTPTLDEQRLREAITQYGGPSLFVIGTADPHYDAEVVQAMTAATNGEAVVIDGADHGMDIPGNPVASVRAVERVVEALSRFLSAPTA